MFSNNKLSRTGVRVAVAAAGLAVMGGVLAAEQSAPVQEIMVQAGRAKSTIVGRSTIGAPIVQTELSYRVSYGDLDLSTHSGATALDKRVHDAAGAACKDLDKLFPLDESDPSCVRKAVDSASVQVRAAVISAENRAKGMKKG